jgi:hypothetical protein
MKITVFQQGWYGRRAQLLSLVLWSELLGGFQQGVGLCEVVDGKKKWWLERIWGAGREFKSWWCELCTLRFLDPDREHNSSMGNAHSLIYSINHKLPSSDIKRQWIRSPRVGSRDVTSSASPFCMSFMKSSSELSIHYDSIRGSRTGRRQRLLKVRFRLEVNPHAVRGP